MPDTQVMRVIIAQYHSGLVRRRPAVLSDPDLTTSDPLRQGDTRHTQAFSESGQCQAAFGRSTVSRSISSRCGGLCIRFMLLSRFWSIYRNIHRKLDLRRYTAVLGSPKSLEIQAETENPVSPANNRHCACISILI
jgi:hypothetical protein